MARFAIHFFLRQIGVHDEPSSKIFDEGEVVFNTFPIDNRYYRNFTYDGTYPTVLDT